MKHTALIGCAPIPWCPLHRVRLPESGLCPSCPPRVAGEVPSTAKCEGEYLGSLGEYSTCSYCGFHECGCDDPRLARTRPVECEDGLCFGCPRCHAEYDERQKAIEPASPEGAERPGWWRTSETAPATEWHLDGVTDIAVTYADDDKRFQIWRRWEASRCWRLHDVPHDTLLAAQECAERLAADTRPGWERDDKGYPGYRHESGTEIFHTERWKWMVTFSDLHSLGSNTYPTAIAAQLAVEEALRG